MNRSFQTKPQPYGVTQKEDSEELSSHTWHKHPGPLCLALHNKAPSKPDDVWGRYARHPTGQEALSDDALADGLNVCRNHQHLLINSRSSAHPQKMFVLRLGFFKSSQGQASLVPRTQSSALGLGECSSLEQVDLHQIHVLGGAGRRSHRPGKQGRVPTRQTRTH